ncbi:TetR/AcrR family transcriptional regulator [Pseudonocardia sp. TRM90224]|uniref:TetR/AcrR family transcriptional regulator n=1 Tax=Pseudonocardia sp. TRM90224 TaxID=2812678 RepID=UPI001E5CE035|nr:TetR family transcriptional regulator [Pseudonocardia sp. TRM90224]
MGEPASPRSARGEQTKAAIVSAALDLFKERGYEKTTMRAVADAAGVSLGNAYYYVATKEHLIQAFYDRMSEAHTEAAAGVLAREKTFARRLAGVYETFLDAAEPYHEFAGKFFKNAAEPTSPLSPFSPESAPAREASIGIFREAVRGSDVKAPAAVLAELPELLWLLHMGVVLFWVHDTSEGQQRSRMLVRHAVPLVDRLVRLTRVPGVRGVADDVIGLVRSLKG